MNRWSVPGALHKYTPVEEALHGVPLYRGLAKLDGATPRLADQIAILRFHHLLARSGSIWGLPNDSLRAGNRCSASGRD